MVTAEPVGLVRTFCACVDAPGEPYLRVPVEWIGRRCNTCGAQLLDGRRHQRRLAAERVARAMLPEPAPAPPVPASAPDQLERLRLERLEVERLEVEQGRRVTAQGATRRSWRTLRARRAVWVDVATGAGVDDQGRPLGVLVGDVGELLATLPADVERVHLVGPRPGGDLDGFHRWRSSTGAWSAGSHYLASLALPVLRFTLDERAVEVQRAASWFGEGGYSPDQARSALALVAAAVDARYAGATLLATPATTGRELFVRMLGDRSWPVLPDDVQELVRSTSGQGRVEIFPPAEGAEQLPGLVELDGRMMYAALCDELPGGEPELGRGRGPDWNPYRRGRYLVRWTVPAGWGHVGLLPLLEGGGWTYPAAPGATGEGWVDAVELFTAERQGWACEVVERLVWPTKAGDPLGPWAAGLLRLRGEVELAAGHDVAAGDLGARAVRAILLHALGAFAGRPHKVTRSAPLEDARAVPAGAELPHVEGDAIVWTEPTPAAWGNLSHPEWSATVWARARVRLLDGPSPTKGQRTGALHVPRAHVVGMLTDALYLTHDPGWPDDGRPGRLRRQRAVAGPLRAPRTLPELLTVRGERG